MTIMPTLFAKLLAARPFDASSTDVGGVEHGRESWKEQRDLEKCTHTRVDSKASRPLRSWWECRKLQIVNDGYKQSCSLCECCTERRQVRDCE